MLQEFNVLFIHCPASNYANYKGSIGQREWAELVTPAGDFYAIAGGGNVI